MNEHESLRDAISRGFYRRIINDKIKITNGKITLNFADFARTYQHFEYGKHGKNLYLLDDLPDAEPFPLVELTVDFSKPYGKIDNEPYINIAPEMPIKSENNNTDTKIFWAHIENLCGNADKETKEWIKDWLSDIFQNPMKKPGTALTFRSEEGTGKGLFFDNLMNKLLGERHLSTSRAVFGERFNGEAKHKLLINFDEGSWDNSKSDIGSLKKFITDKTFSFEEKGKDVVLLPNYARTVFTSNASWIMKNDGSRRFCMLNPIKENYATPEYFKNLFEAIENDGICKKFLYELETRIITHDLRTAPKTDEYYSQQEISYDYYDDFLNEIFNDDAIMIKDCIQFWSEASDLLKICTPENALLYFNSLYPNISITKTKLFQRIKDKTKKFGYEVKSIVKFENGFSNRYWEFTKILKPKSKITDITLITDITDITLITDTSTDKFLNVKAIKNDTVICNNVIESVIEQPAQQAERQPKTKKITDIFIGTPITQYENGTAKVEFNPTQATEFVTVNKLIDGAETAKDANVETYKNFIFELDNEDIETQKERARKLFEKKIINRAVYSGSKSIHCRITVEDEPDNKEQYKYIWKKFNEKYFENKADTACSNPARLTRRPNAIRSNGVKQELLFLSNEVLNYNWRKEYEQEKSIADYLQKQQINKINNNDKTPAETLLQRDIPVEARKLLTNNFQDGERHKEIPKAISFLKHCGYSLTEIENLVKATQIKDGKNYVKNIYEFVK
jgi:hypothetical protein